LLLLTIVLLYSLANTRNTVALGLRGNVCYTCKTGCTRPKVRSLWKEHPEISVFSHV